MDGTSTTLTPNNVSGIRLGQGLSWWRRSEHEPVDNGLLRFSIEDRGTDKAIHTHILDTSFMLLEHIRVFYWSEGASAEQAMRMAERTIEIIDKMYRDDSYRRNMSLDDIERIEITRDHIAEWRSSNPRDDVLVGPPRTYVIPGIPNDLGHNPHL